MFSENCSPYGNPFPSFVKYTMQCAVWWGHKGSIITDSALARGDLAAGVEERMPHIDCLTQLSFVTWICQLCSTTNTSKKYERTRLGNLLKDAPHWLFLLLINCNILVLGFRLLKHILILPKNHNLSDKAWNNFAISRLKDAKTLQKEVHK